MKKTWLILSAALVLTAACRHKPDDGTGIVPTDSLTPVTIVKPPHFPYMSIPEDNPPYQERIDLGRALYYDTRLSNDGRACAGCHHQVQGFTSSRPSGEMPVLPHVNLAWTTNWMWDGSQTGSLEDVMLYEVKDFFAADLDKINGIAAYKTGFKRAFGVDKITYKELAYALAQFERTMNAGNSRYSRYLAGTEPLTPDQEKGRAIFFSEKGDCYHCHLNPTLTDNSFHNTGIDSPVVLPKDKGLFNVTGKAYDLGKFRTPNLHNAALRTSFMHDGRFTSLEEVVEFYNNGVKKVNNLDPVMTKQGKEDGLNLTAQDKYYLIEFLKSFTDSTFITNPALGAP
jgi:cytochrome c peroxidase